MSGSIGGDAKSGDASPYRNWLTARWYHQLSEDLKKAEREGRVDEAEALRARLAAAVVVDFADLLPGRVQFGMHVTVFGLEEEEEQSFQIVSADEARSAPGLLAVEAPLAQALMGAIEGQTVRVVLANGSNSEFEVTHVTLKPF